METNPLEFEPPEEHPYQATIGDLSWPMRKAVWAAEKKVGSKNIREVVNILDPEDRENLVRESFWRLLGAIKFEKYFPDNNPETKQHLASEIIRLLDVVWNNRGKSPEEMEIFNQQFYQDIKDKLKIIQEREEIKKFLDQHHVLSFDTKDNPVFDDRSKQERAWTELLSIASESIEDPDLFAVAATEALTTGLGPFSSQQEKLRRTKESIEPFGMRYKPEVIQAAKDIIECVDGAIGTWVSLHQEKR